MPNLLAQFEKFWTVLTSHFQEILQRDFVIHLNMYGYILWMELENVDIHFCTPFDCSCLRLHPMLEFF